MLPRPASDEGWLAGLVASSLEGSLLEDPLPLPPQKWGEPSSSEGWCSPRSLLEDLGGVLEDPMFNPLVAWEPEQPDGAASASAPTAALPSAGAAKHAKLTLGELPNCVLVSVLGHLDARMLCVLPAVAREWGELATDPQVWQTQIRRRYGALEGALPEGALRPPVGGSWREHYFALGSPGGERHWGRLAVAGHASRASCWLFINHAVYDVTPFMHKHPGGAESLLLFGATDASEAFNEVSHSKAAFALMDDLRVAGLQLPPEGCPACLLPPSEAAAPEGRPEARGHRRTRSEPARPSAVDTLRSYLGSLPSLDQLNEAASAYALDPASMPVLPSVRWPVEGAAFLERLAIAWRTGFEASERLQHLLLERWHSTTTFDPDAAPRYF